MRSVQRRPEVRHDLIANAEYIAQGNLRAALRFLDSVEATILFLADNREAGQRFTSSDPRLSELRLRTVDGFRNYVIVYRLLNDGIEIVRVLHGARDIDALFQVL